MANGQVQTINALTATATPAVEKQPSTMGPTYDDFHAKKELCRLLNASEEHFEFLKAMFEAGRECGSGWMRDCLSTMKRCESVCDTVKRDCMSLEAIVRATCCPGQNLYSQITIDEFSDNNQVNLVVPVIDFAPGFVNAFPVPPSAAIRLEHLARPGYIPKKIAVDFALANNGTNYLDIEVQFYLGPGGTLKGKELGPAFSGNQFLNKDGTQIHLDFPPYRGRPVDVGSIEKLAVEIRHNGGVNNVVSAQVIVYHDAECFYELCKAPRPVC